MTFFQPLPYLTSIKVLTLIAMSFAGVTTTSAQQVDRDQLLNERFQENHTRKARVKPQGLAAKAGSAVEWQPDLQKALELSEQTGKPVFWYVPTLPRTFMDRKDVIDQYMKAGPFSWPAIIALINENYIPVRQIPNSKVAEQYGLATYKFVEPGFVIISAGKVVQTSDRLSTLHPQWLFQLIGKSAAKPSTWDALASKSDRKSINRVWADFVSHKPIEVDVVVPAEDAMELKLVQGMQLFREGKHAEANKWWEEAAKQHPDHPLAWKAAHEALGIGPFVRGFEVFLLLNAQQQQAGVKSLGSAAPEGTFTAEQLWTLGATYLLDMQREDGGFYDSDYDFGGSDSMPNVHMAVTAICGWSLLRAEKHVDPALAKRIQVSLQKAIDFCSDDSNINPKDRDELLWAEAYRLRFLAAVGSSKAAPSQASLGLIAKRLEDLQSGNGTWFHEYPNAFVTATALIALKDAANSGVKIDPERISSGLARLESQRYENGAYPYAVRRGNSGRSEPIEASAGRIPLCSYARFLWDKEDDSELAKAADIGLKYHDLLAKALKYDNHTDTYAFGGFFFWYDMHARSEAIASVKDSAIRKSLAKKQLDLILTLPELDGCFIDSHELGRCYGTASALLCLDLMEQAISAR